MTKNKQFQLKSVLRDWQLYLMALPAIVLLFLFAYMPMGGLIIAFKNFDFQKGIFGSDWIQPITKNFEILFKSPAAFTAIKNTLLLNALFISVGTCFALLLAIGFNELRSRHFKKIAQSLTFLPYFISTVVLGVLVSGMLTFETGAVNNWLEALGFERIAFYMEPKYWPGILLITNIWKGAGYSSIVYLAAITGIDPTYYEAAQIDGASRLRQIWSVTLPLLRTTIIVLTILAVGKIMNADFGFFYNVTRDIPTLYSTTDVLDTYIYRALRRMGDISISSATGFFQSVISFALVMISNAVANRIEPGSALF